MGLRARAAIRVVQAVTQAPQDADGIATALTRALVAELGTCAVVALSEPGLVWTARRERALVVATDEVACLRLGALASDDGRLAADDAAAWAERFGLPRDSRALVFPLHGDAGVVGHVLLFRGASEEELDVAGVDAVRACVEHAELALAHAAGARARAEVEDRLRSVLAAARGGIWEYDLASGTSYWNESFRDLYGFPPGAPARSELCRSRVHPADLARVVGRFESEIARGTPSYQQSFRIIHPERGERHLLDFVRLVTSEGGAPLRAGGITLDVSELVAAQQAAVELGNRLRASELAGGVGTYDLDIPSGQVFFSDGMRALFGYEGDLPLTRQDLHARMRPDDVAEAQEKLEEAIRSGEYRAEFRLVLPNGTTRWINSRGEVMRDEAGMPRRLIGVNVDVTARKAAEQTLAEAVRLRDEFLHVASHELRTPLTALRLQIESMHRLLEPGSRLEKKLEVATRQTERLTALTEALLDVTRIASGRLELELAAFDLGELAGEVVERFAPIAASSGSELRLQLGAAITGTWDRARLDQVLTNLVSNALKYGAAKPVLVDVHRDEDGAVIQVCDQGIGIPERDQARVFDRFARGVPAAHYGGLGLGLYIARELVEAHGGSISVASVYGQGATFSVRLPRTAKVTTRAAALSASS